MRSQELTNRLLASWGRDFLNDPLVSKPFYQYWTLPMVLAFIKWRTLKGVRWFSNNELESRSGSTDKNLDRSHFVSLRDLRDAEAQLGPAINESVSEPFDELQWACKGGRVAANTLQLEDGLQRQIGDVQWIHLRLADDVMELFHAKDPQARRLRNIFVDRDKCLAEWWPAMDVPMPPARRGRRAQDAQIIEAALELVRSGERLPPLVPLPPRW